MAAIGNINHIRSSAIASSSFHGTTISIFQKATSERYKNITLKLKTDVYHEIFKTLPVYYTKNLQVKRGKPEYPINSKNSLLFDPDENY